MIDKDSKSEHGHKMFAGLLEIRLHGRGGQGGVTCAKILAAVYARLGYDVQSFGDYAGERSGAPVRAYVRVSPEAVTNRNKVYEPHHLLVLDPTLLGADVLAGLAPGGVLLINTPEPPASFGAQFDAWRLVTVDATAIARRHGIGTRSVVIVNTTIAGAFMRALDLPWEALEAAYRSLGFLSNLKAARDAYDAAIVREPLVVLRPGAPQAAAPRPVPIVELVAHVEGPPPLLKTGNWRTQTPRYVKNLAPCTAWCPAGNDVIGFIQALAKNDAEAQASKILGRTTPLSAICGRVCPAPCMDGCNRAEMDGAVNIRGLERWVADHAPVGARENIEAKTPTRRRRVAIVGGGPAGLSAAFELAKGGHSATILDAERALGGVLRTGIPTYRLSRDALDREVGDILALGVTARLGARLDRASVAALSKEFDGVILATGLQRLRGIDGPGANLEGVEQGIGFLHRVNLEGGGPLSGHVVVLGGGNTAMDCARSAIRAGASKVTVAYRRTRAEMPAIAEEVGEAIEEGVELLLLRAPVGFAGQGKVGSVILAEVELGEPDSTGRRSPIVSDRKVELACDHVLLALGQSSDLSLLPEGSKLVSGRVTDSAGKQTNVFAAGDLATGDGTVAHAIGDGRRAAGRLLASLAEPAHPFERPDKASAVPATDIRFDHFAPAPPARARHLPLETRRSSFEEGNLGLDGSAEAHRCFSCGDCTQCDTCLVYCPEGIIRRADRADDPYAVDYSYCKGCGICVTECPRKAIIMEATGVA